jgi:hypothetical protein
VRTKHEIVKVMDGCENLSELAWRQALGQAGK